MILLALAACNPPNPYTFGGSPVWELFPFDGSRTWTYINTDLELSYKMVATSVLEPEVRDQKNVYTVAYTQDCIANDPYCTGAVMRKIQWSSDIEDGVFIWGYVIGEGTIQELDPPIQVALDTEKRDQFVDTDTAGATWTSTLVGEEPCPIAMNADWDDCSQFEITVAGGAADFDGYPIAGKWWATKGNGVAAMEIVTDPGQWQLDDIDCQDECDGNW
jgi:hypothetical protein